MNSLRYLDAQGQDTAFLWEMEGLAAGLNALRQRLRRKGGSNVWKDRGNVWKGLKELSPCSRSGLSRWSSVKFIGWLLSVCLRKWDGVVLWIGNLR